MFKFCSGLFFFESLRQVSICNLKCHVYNYDTMCRYRAALQAKKERTSKAAASFGPKVKQFVNPKEVHIYNSSDHSLFQGVQEFPPVSPPSAVTVTLSMSPY